MFTLAVFHDKLHVVSQTSFRLYFFFWLFVNDVFEPVKKQGIILPTKGINCRRVFEHSRKLIVAVDASTRISWK